MFFFKNVTLFESMLEKVFLASLTKIILKNRFLMILASAYPIHIRSSSRVENSDGSTFIVGIARCMTESRLSLKIQKISSTLQLHLDSNYAWMHYKEKQRQIHITTYLHAQQNYEVMTRKYKKVGTISSIAMY